MYFSFRYVIDTSPYMEDASIVKEVLIKGQVYGAKVRINLLLNKDQLEGVDELFVGVGNKLNVATMRIDLSRQLPFEHPLMASDSNLDQSSFILIVVVASVAFVVLIIGLILVVVFRQRISESFKCGVYLVPHEDQDEAETEKDKNGEPKKIPLGDPEKAALQPSQPPPPETEF